MKNLINPKKLHHSKWTAVSPKNKELHFLIIKVHYSDEGEVEQCILQAIMTKNEYEIDWRELKDSHVWLQGWL